MNRRNIFIYAQEIIYFPYLHTIKEKLWIIYFVHYKRTLDENKVKTKLLVILIQRSSI